MKPEYAWILIVSLFWGGYPLVARGANLGGPLGALILSTVSLTTILAATWSTSSFAWPVPAAAIRLVIAGAMMGIGLLAFNALAVSRQIEASISIPVVDTGMLIVSVLAAVLFFAEPITLKKFVGLALLVAGIAVLRPA
jgi:drug/metabolite transporter (DMT)-like permease